jgi:menaquinone-dependent protoporphyrinogen IX oxidase
MNILSLKLDIFNGTDTISPIYEVHSWEKAEEIIRNTQALLADKPNATFSFEVFGNSTAHIA